MDSIILSLTFISILITFQDVQKKSKRIEQNGMAVTWFFTNQRVHFEVSAPTTGWVTVGFNETNSLNGAYLLMSRVYDSCPEVVEHTVLSHGVYRPIEEVLTSVADVEGIENMIASRIQFSLPTSNYAKHAKMLEEGQQIYMTLAYSESDDFQHHSIMRTTVQVQL
ncbi:DOMON domain-containing protein [Reichenbachiella sp.]